MGQVMQEPLAQGVALAAVVALAAEAVLEHQDKVIRVAPAIQVVLITAAAAGVARAQLAEMAAMSAATEALGHRLLLQAPL